MFNIMKKIPILFRVIVTWITLVQKINSESVECIYTEMKVDFQNALSLDEAACEYNGMMYNLNTIKSAAATNKIENQAHELKRFESGKSKLFLTDVEISKGSIVASEKSSVLLSSDEKYDEFVHVQSCGTSCGTKSVVAFRVITADNETTSSLTELHDNLFGDSFNFITQFSACSHGKLNFVPFAGETETKEYIVGGVGEINIIWNSVGIPSTLVRDDVLKAATEKYGNLTTQFDYVIICLPPHTLIQGRSDWIAYAFLNNYLSVFNDEHCNSASTQLHELGHSLGLQHSNPDYSDQSCIMGYTYEQDDGPAMCFNGPKSFELGWYADSHVYVNASVYHEWNELTFNLVGVADYDRRNNMATIIQIFGVFDEYDYYVAFNRKIGPNAGTKQGGDKILITKRSSGAESANSYLLAELDETNSTYFIFNNDDSSHALIEVTSINLAADPGYATVTVTRYKKVCNSDEFCDDFNSCTIDFCDFNASVALAPGTGVCKNEEMSCEDCGSTFSLEIKTNDYPSQVYWSLFNVDKNHQVKKGDSYVEKGTYFEKFCVELANYRFTVNENIYKKNTPQYHAKIHQKTFYETKLDGVNIQSNEFSDTPFEFGIVCTEENCNDFDACTIDVFDPDTRLCTFQSQSDCQEGLLLEVNITLDNYPDQTSWNVIEQSTGKTLLSGGPYPWFGRRKAPTSTLSKVQQFTNVQYNEETYKWPYVYESIRIENGILAIFNIYDTFGDGICCMEGFGNYTVSVDNEAIAQGGGFTFFDRWFIGPKPSCGGGKVPFSIYIKMDNDPASIRWTFFNDATNTGWSEGPYTNAKPDELVEYQTNKCVLLGYDFTFTIYDSGGNGLCCGGYYVVLVDGKLRANGDEFTNSEATPVSTKGIRRNLAVERGSPRISVSSKENSRYQSRRLVVGEDCPGILQFPPTFQPTAQPSISPTSLSNNPSNTPSITPSTSYLPSMYVESLSFRDSWGIVLNNEGENSVPSYNNATQKNDFDIFNAVKLKYYISKGRSQEEFICNIYDKETCLTKSNDTSVIVYNTYIDINEDKNYDEAYVIIKFNASSIHHSVFWSDLSNSKGLLSYCVKSELLIKNVTYLSASFADTKVQTTVNLESGLAIERTDFVRDEKLTATKMAVFEVHACICSDDLSCMLQSHDLYQNSDLAICIFPSNSEMVITKFQSLYFYQDGIAKYMPIDRGEANELTNVIINHHVAYVRTRLVSLFFNVPNPSNILIAGQVYLEFDKETKRRFLQSHSQYDSANVSFRLEVKIYHSNSYSKLCYSILMLFVLTFVVRYKFLKSNIDYAYSPLST